jgi:hypothetical protein
MISSSACFGTGFTPKPGPGITITYNAIGSPVFSKDGKEIGSGYFGRELSEALADVPEARADAEKWRNYKLCSLSLSLIASAITIAGVAAIEPGAGINARNAFSIASILTGSFPLAIGSTLCNLAADARLQDAILRYNDKARAASPVKLSLTGLRVDW